MEIEKRTRYLELYDKYYNFLTERQREIFQMYLIEDMSYAEIGEVLNTSRNNAFDTVKKAIIKLEETKEKMESE